MLRGLLLLRRGRAFKAYNKVNELFLSSPLLSRLRMARLRCGHQCATRRSQDCIS